MKKDLLHTVMAAGLGLTPAEYMLALELPEALREVIQDIKAGFEEKFGIPGGHTRAQVTLVKFSQFEMLEPRLLARLRMLAAACNPFLLELQGFGSLPSHTIYIQVLGKLPILNTLRNLRKAQHLLRINEDLRPWFIAEPSIVIARKLQPGQYEKAWRFYSRQDFHSRFPATAICLLKKQDAGWKHVAGFPFEHSNVTNKQQKLF